MLVELIDSLINEVGTGINASVIRARLLTLREQAEAVEARLGAVKLELKQTRSNLKRLEKDSNTEQITSKQDSLEEVAVKILQLLSNPLPANTISQYQGTPSLEQMARRLGIKDVVAQYHADKLVEKGMIELTAYVPRRGTICVLTPKGTAYVVENNLV